MNVNVPNGYKQTKVGVIPEDWEVTTLKNILSKNIQNGYSPICPDKDTGHWILGLGALSREKKLNIYDRKPAPNNDDKVKQFILEENDFLISRANTPERVGFSGVFRSNEKIYSYPDLMMRFRVSEELVDIDYVENCLKSFRVLRYLQSSAAGSSSSMVKINKKVVENIRFPLPPLKEQQKIAQILTTWEKAISKQEALIAEKEQLKKGLMQKLLSGEVRFEGFDGEWEEVRLGDIFAERSKRYKSLATEEIEIYSELLSVGVNTGVTKRSENDAKDNSSSDKSNYKILNKNDIAYNTMRMWQGASGVSSMNGIVSPAYTIVYLKKDYCIEFFGLLFKMHRVVFDFYRYSQGLTSDTWNLKYPHFSEVKVKIPTSKQEQQKIAQLLTIADKEIELLKEELEALKEQKRGLMQRLLTGEVRVKIDGGEIK